MKLAIFIVLCGLALTDTALRLVCFNTFEPSILLVAMSGKVLP